MATHRIPPGFIELARDMATHSTPTAELYNSQGIPVVPNVVRPHAANDESHHGQSVVDAGNPLDVAGTLEALQKSRDVLTHAVEDLRTTWTAFAPSCTRWRRASVRW